MREQRECDGEIKINRALVMIMPCKNQTWIPSPSTGAGVNDLTVRLAQDAGLFSVADQKTEESLHVC